MNPINQTLFTARVTDDVPPRLSVEFGQGNGFQKDGGPCSAKVMVNATRQIRVHLDNKTVANEALGNLAAAQDCGRSLVLRQASQNSYDYVHDNEDSEGVNLSQVTLQIQGLSLMAKFEAGGAAPVAPVMPGATATPTHSNPWGDWGASPASTTTPTKPNLTGWGDWGKGVPGAVAPVVVAAPQPPVQRLRGDLPQEIWSNKRLVGTLYSSYQWYVNNPNRPSGGKDQADYDLLYPIFLKEERLYATLQQKLRAAAALDRLTGCLPIDPYFPNHHLRSLGGAYALFENAYDEYKKFAGKPKPSVAQSAVEHMFMNSGQMMSPVNYESLLEKEKEYLTEQAKNEYNAAN